MKITKKTKLGNATVEDHRNWLINELTPPYSLNAQDPATRYLLNCFLELIDKAIKK